jgi:altronate dehydratase small subunit
MKKKALLIHTDDNVANALEDIEQGEVVKIFPSEQLEVSAIDRIPFGFKLALYDIPVSGEVLKYGECIGTAVKHIHRGECVHVHNIAGRRGRGDL